MAAASASRNPGMMQLVLDLRQNGVAPAIIDIMEKTPREIDRKSVV